MDDLQHLKDRFAAQPWLDLPDHALTPANRVFTMLHPDEKRLYYWLASEVAKGQHPTVDLGAYFGGSTACLATGFAAAGKTPMIHAYDRFKVRDKARKARLFERGVPAFDGVNAKPTVRKLLRPWIENISLHAGDLRDQKWGGAPVEILVVDVAKHASTADHVAAQFFPHLIPGQSIVVQQDFLNQFQPWLAAQMSLFAEYFEPLTLCHYESVAFLCTKEIPQAAIEALQVDHLDDDAYVAHIRDMLGRLGASGATARAERMLAAAEKHPDKRAAHSLSRALGARQN